MHREKENKRNLDKYRKIIADIIKLLLSENKYTRMRNYEFYGGKSVLIKWKYNIFTNSPYCTDSIEQELRREIK